MLKLGLAPSRRRLEIGLRGSASAIAVLACAATASAQTIVLSTDGQSVIQTTDNTGDPSVLITGDDISFTLDGATLTSTTFAPVGNRDTIGAIRIEGDNASIVIGSGGVIDAAGVGIKVRILGIPSPTPFPAGASVVNYGLIDGALDDGVELSNGSLIENYGIIRGGSAYAPNAAPVGSLGDGASIFPQPRSVGEVPADGQVLGVLINHAGAEIHGHRFGVSVTNVLINDGLIRSDFGGVFHGGGGPYFAGATLLGAPRAIGVIDNSGSIIAGQWDGILTESVSIPSTVQTFDLSLIDAPGDAAALFDRGTLDFGAFDLRIENTGLIRTSAPAGGGFNIEFFNPDTNQYELLFVTSTFHAINAGSAAGYIYNGLGATIESPNGAGALSLAAIDAHLAAPGAIRLDNQGTITGNILGSDGQELIFNGGTINGSIALGLGDDLVYLGAGSALTGDLTLGPGDDVLVADTTSILGGLADGGDGDDFLMLILGGALSTSRLYSFERVQTFGTGPLDNIDLSEVSRILVGGGGVLDIGSTGFTGEVEISPGGRLVGLGTLGLVIIRDGGAVAPGNSIGTINVVGDVTFDAGSVYEVEVNATASDQILAGGAVTINGGTVNVSGENGVDLPPGLSLPTYVILAGAGGRTGQFSAVADTLQFYAARLDYTPTEVRLFLDPFGADFLAAAQTPNQIAVGGALQGALLTAQGDLAAVMRAAYPGLGPEALRDGLDQTAGLVHGAAAAGLSQAALRAARAAAGRHESIEAGRTRVWAAGFYLGTDFRDSGIRADAFGALAGAEHGVRDDLAAGVFAGFLGSQGRDDVGSDIDPTGYVLGSTVRWGRGGFFLGAQGGYAKAGGDGVRRMAIGGVARAAAMDSEIHGFFLAADAGFAFPLSHAAELTPFVSFQNTSLRSDSFSENGAGALNLSVSDFEFDRRTLRAGAALTATAGAVSFSVESGLQTELGDRSARFVATLDGVPLSAFQVAGDRLSDNAGFAGAEIAAGLGAGFFASIAYRGEIGARHTAHGGQARIGLEF